MQKEAIVSLLGLLAALVVLQSARAADTVYRKTTDKAVQGTVNEISKTQITVKPKVGDAVTIPANDVAEVRWDGEPAALNLARNNEEAGRLEQALEGYQEAAEEAGSQNENLQTDLEFLIARTRIKMALAAPEELAEAIEAMETFRSQHGDHFRYYPAVHLLGRAYLAAENFEKARATFELLGQAPWSDYQMAAKIANARLKLKQGDLEGAREAFDQVIELPTETPAAKARRHEALLGKAHALQQQNQYDQAIQVLNQVIREVSPDQARIQAEAYLRKGNCLQAQNQVKEAILAYLHVDILFAAQKSVHAEALYHLAQLWGSVNKPARAADARARLEGDYPDSPWTEKLASAGG